jgi:predicted AlkP superfamily pyrophosphatase or phosphodiesterase
MARVAFFMLDGVRPDAILAANCPNVTALRTAGASTLQARSLLPAITLPCHTSIFHSVPPARHGITSNDWHPMARPLPGLFEVIRQGGLSSAFFYSWEQLRDLSRPGSVSYSFYHDGHERPDGDDITAAEVVDYLANHQPDFIFVYLGCVDTAGHDYGWMSPEYLAQLERADAALGRILAALPEDYTIVLQADHGGHDRNHGEDIPEDINIPWMAAGAGIRRGHTIASPVSLLSTAPTVARLLGLSAPADWEGKAVDEIFETRD